MKILLLLLAVLINSCALSPQSVALRPLLDVPGYPIGRGRTLSLEVLDQRPVTYFGTRGGTYDTALITPRTDVAQTVRQALAERLTADGFRVISPQPGAPIGMKVDIQRIQYVAKSDSIVNEVHTSAAIGVLVHNGERSMTSQYQASRIHQVLTPPDEADNEDYINEVVAETLQRLLQDKAVLDVLRQ
jgi:uncharacterized lipoprotein YajG